MTKGVKGNFARAQDEFGKNTPCGVARAEEHDGETGFVGIHGVLAGADALFLRASSIRPQSARTFSRVAKEGVEDDPDGEIYWKIAHGIRFTGMSAFRETLSDREIWQIVLFTKHMNSLPSGIQQTWAAGKASR